MCPHRVMDIERTYRDVAEFFVWGFALRRNGSMMFSVGEGHLGLGTLIVRMCDILQSTRHVEFVETVTQLVDWMRSCSEGYREVEFNDPQQTRQLYNPHIALLSWMSPCALAAYDKRNANATYDALFSKCREMIDPLYAQTDAANSIYHCLNVGIPRFAKDASNVEQTKLFRTITALEPHLLSLARSAWESGDQCGGYVSQGLPSNVFARQGCAVTASDLAGGWQPKRCNDRSFASHFNRFEQGPAGCWSKQPGTWWEHNGPWQEHSGPWQEPPGPRWDPKGPRNPQQPDWPPHLALGPPADLPAHMSMRPLQMPPHMAAGPHRRDDHGHGNTKQQGHAHASSNWRKRFRNDDRPSRTHSIRTAW